MVFVCLFSLVIKLRSNLALFWNRKNREIRLGFGKESRIPVETDNNIVNKSDRNDEENKSADGWSSLIRIIR